MPKTVFKEIEFLGGPRDGERWNVAEGVRTVVFPRLIGLRGSAPMFVEGRYQQVQGTTRFFAWVEGGGPLP